MNIETSPLNKTQVTKDIGFPDGSVVKNMPANAGDMDLIPESGRYPGEENGNPLHYSCLGNPMERGAWKARVHGITEELDMALAIKQQQNIY